MKNQFEALKEIAHDIGVSIKIARSGDAFKQGIHRLYPNIHDLEDALDVAERDGFKTIYIHNSNTFGKV